MIITRNWLSKYLELSDISNDQITVALNSLGFEVENETDYSKLNSNLIIGFVEESKPVEGTHLRINKINIGNEVKNIICGAPNIREVQYVIVGINGSVIANGLTLSEREIKGYKSEGMVCALNEIGIHPNVLTEEEKEAIYVINSSKIKKNDLGKSIEATIFNDYIWECDLTLNRSDALAAFQLCKEIANFFNIKISNNLKTEERETPSISNDIISDNIDNDLRTLAIEEFSIKDRRNILESKNDLMLKMIDIKSSNNVFEDLASLTTWETAQPIILIDKDKVNKLSLCKENIDSKELIVIKDGNKIVNKIGLKVEEEFKVNSETKNVLVLYLNFDPIVMRTQQKNLNESNVDLQRYMKPINKDLFLLASKQLIHNFNENGIIIENEKLGVIKSTDKSANRYVVSKEKISNLLGIELSFSEIKCLFKTLDFEIIDKGLEIEFVVDESRTDLYGDADICEEIARLYGYDNIAETPLKIKARMTNSDIAKKMENRLGNHLIGLGFNNTKTYALVEENANKEWNLFGLDDQIKLMSPLSKLHEVYRLSLSKSLLDVAISNSLNGNKNLMLWEIANIQTIKIREKHLAILTTGEILKDKLTNDSIEGSYYYHKGIIENILNMYNINPARISFRKMSADKIKIHPYISSEILIDDQLIGFIFKLNPSFEGTKKIEKTFITEINLDLINNLSEKVVTFEEWSKFQSSTRDMSIQIGEDVSYEEIMKVLPKGVENLIAIKLVDDFQNEQLKASKEKSMTFKFTFNSFVKQLNDEEIEKEWNKIIDSVKNELKAIIR